VLSLRGANARQTIAGIEKKLADISAGFPKGVEAKVFTIAAIWWTRRSIRFHTP